MIPNTTPTPNELYNGEMKKMSDTELRVVLIITRKTLGWEIDNETGMRKTEDWINQTQLKKLSGRGSAAISKAIDNCIKMGWIEARNKKGELLDTKDKRKRLGYAGKVYYRLGRIFLDKTIAIQKANSNNEIEYEKRTAESEQQKANRNKRNPLTKETYLQTNSVSKKRSPKRKDFVVKKEIYKEISDAYQRYKGIELNGAEFGEVKRATKTMLYSGRTKENIIDFMKLVSQICEDMKDDEKLAKKYCWLENWTLLTIKRKMPEFLAGKFQDSEDVEIPSYARGWQK